MKPDREPNLPLAQRLWQPGRPGQARPGPPHAGPGCEPGTLIKAARPGPASPPCPIRLVLGRGGLGGSGRVGPGRAGPGRSSRREVPLQAGPGRSSGHQAPLRSGVERGRAGPAGEGGAGRGGPGVCLHPLPLHLPEVVLAPGPSPSVPWTPATCSPAAGRGMWAACGEVPREVWGRDRKGRGAAWGAGGPIGGGPEGFVQERASA